MEDLHEQLQILRAELQNRHRQLETSMEYLESANKRFDSLFENLPVACVSCEPHGSILQWNRAATGLFGYPPHDALSRPVWEVITPCSNYSIDEHMQKIQQQIQRVCAGEALMDMEEEYLSCYGRTVRVVGNCFPLRSHDQSIVGAMYAWIDITLRHQLEQQIELQLQKAKENNVILEQQRQQLALANSKLAALVTQDPLTNLRNRRFFMEQVEQSVAYHRRHKNIFSVLLLDIEQFTAYNKRHGVDAGDKILCDLAGLLTEIVRPYDIVARYDGEEFALLLPGADQQGAGALVERIKERMSQYSWQPAPISVQYGAVTIKDNIHSALEMLEYAENALKQAVSKGTGAYVHHQEIHLSKQAAALSG